MTNLFKVGLGLFALLAVVSLGILFATKDVRPVIICTSLDHGTRPRQYCVMNPFRNRGPESAAEKVLVELRDGNVNVLQPLLSDEEKQHILENERKYRIKDWHIGSRSSGDSIDIVYWVERDAQNLAISANYVEEVTLTVAKDSSGWKANQYRAIY